MTYPRALVVAFATIAFCLSACSVGEVSHRHDPQLIAPVPAQVAELPRPLPGAEIPENIVYCIGDEGVFVDLLGQTEQNGTAYYFVGVYYSLLARNPFLSTVRPVLISQEEGETCRGVPEFDYRQGLAHYLSTESAVELETQKYRRFIELAGGKEPFKLLLQQWRDAGNQLDPEQRSALSALAVEVENES